MEGPVDLSARDTGIMVLMVTLVVTYLNLGLRPISCRWVKAYFIAWPVAAAPPSSSCRPRRITDRIVAAHRGHRLMLSALDLARRIEAGRLTPRPSSICARRRSPRAKPRSARSPSLDLEARGAPPRRAGLAAHAAARTAGRHQGHFRHRRLADRLWLADLCRPPPARRRRDGRAGAPRRRHRPRQDRHAPNSPRLQPAGRATRATSRIRRAARPRARPPRSPPAWCRSRLGSQTGGSVIRPAAYCGVAGYKPSFRLLPTVGMKCFSWSLDTVGLFGAGVADVAFAAAAITGRDLRVDRAAPAAPPRSRWCAPTLWPRPAPTCRPRSSTPRARPQAAGARRQGCRRCRRSSRTPCSAHAHHPGLRGLSRAGLRIRPPSRPARADPARAARRGPPRSTSDAYDEARRTARRARQAFADLMADTDVILTPSAPGAAPHGLGSTGIADLQPAVDADGDALRQRAGAVDAAGLPLGVQIVGRFGRDRVALEAAALPRAGDCAARRAAAQSNDII